MKSETKFIRKGAGYHFKENHGVVTFEIAGMADTDSEFEMMREKTEIQSTDLSEARCQQVGEYRIPIWGELTNTYPQEVNALVRENKLLPQLLKKRVEFLFGKGVYLYTEELSDDGKVLRKYETDKAVQTWLADFERNGGDNFSDYLYSLIDDYYRFGTCCSQFHFANRRKEILGTENVIPEQVLLSLSYVPAADCRLATSKEGTIGKRIRRKDCDAVCIGDWTHRSADDFEIYPLFDDSKPFGNAEPISFRTEHTNGKNLYSYNDWYFGLRDWVKASNLTPKYLNSYLRTALNAHVHCQIPESWYLSQKETLQTLCQSNLITDDKAQMVEEYRGVRLLDEQGQPYTYNENMMQDLIAKELEKITEMLSGEGKNQGKLYASLKVRDEGWTFTEFPGKFKEYFESVISYDKRADQVTLAGLGISSSITNVEAEGVLSKSGSDVYYNYVVYLNTLSRAEQFVCRDINKALQLAFPAKYNKGLRIGFRIEIPVRQQEIAPADRLDNRNF